MSDLGYRSQEEVAEPESLDNPKQDILFFGGALIGLYLFLDVLSWLFEGGGIFSITSTLLTVHSRPPIVNVDKDGLRFPITVFIWLVVFGLCRLFNFYPSISKRGQSLLAIAVILGGGFLVDAVLGERIITHYMANHGYNRCVNGDWEKGNGKSRVWFADYVLTSADCREHRP
jgi:hypothetical protein